MSEAPRGPDDARDLELAGELRVVVSRLRRRMREHGTVGDLTASQVSVLLRLEREGPATVAGLARAEGVRPQSMGTTTAALEAAGLVSGAADPVDRRQIILSITPACRKRLAAARAARQDWLFRVLRAEFTPAERAQLSAATGLLKRIAEAPHGR